MHHGRSDSLLSDREFGELWPQIAADVHSSLMRKLVGEDDADTKDQLRKQLERQAGWNVKV